MSVEAYVWALRATAAATLLAGGFALARGRTALVGFVPVLASLGCVAWRTAQVGHLPLASLHETLQTFAAALVVASTAMCARRSALAHGLCLLGAAALWGASSVASPRPTPLVPALQTLWFEIHVASSFVAYACFAVGAAAAGVHLSRGDHVERDVLEGANRWGFAWFTWAMVSGGIWAYVAWGTYWLWHVKELWSGVLWTVYAALIHLPHLPRWRGARQSALTLAGFTAMLFTYLGVGLLMRNTHQF